MACHQPHTHSQQHLHPSIPRNVSRLASPSLPKVSSHAEDYPVFTPSYEEDPLPEYQNLFSDIRSSSQGWRRIDPDAESANKQHSTTVSERSICSAIEHLSNRNLSINRAFLNQPTPISNTPKSFSKRTGSDAKLVSARKVCTPGTSARVTELDQKKTENGTSDATQHQHQNTCLQEKNKGAMLSWLFPKLRSKSKLAMPSPKNADSENMSQLSKGWGVLSIEAVKKELLEANQRRDAALAEVSEMANSLGELQHKLATLETHCEELKKALKQAKHSKSVQTLDRPTSSKKFKSISGRKDDRMPVPAEAMVESFLQIISEARLSMKQFCKALLRHAGESGDDLIEKLNSLLEPYEITVSSKASRVLLYHLEAVVNRSLYEDFENCVFQKNGCAKLLDPLRSRRDNFSAFVALRNLSWNDVLQKGTKYHSEEFSKFCDEKMSCIVSKLGWSKPWPEQLLQCFFVATKCIWLLHLLSFSFDPPLTILRVDENRAFDSVYMDNVVAYDEQNVKGGLRVKVMVMPGFYVEDRVVSCRVICSV